MNDFLSDTRALAAEAYLYLYPLVTMEVTRQQSVLGASGNPMQGPPNAFRHLRRFPDASFRTVVRPNFDTLYSSAWLDLRSGPVVIDVPDTHGRYYMLPMLDMWTEVFANPGARTTGTGPQRYLLTAEAGTPDVEGAVTIHAPTPLVWVIGRIEAGPDDAAEVNALQDGLGITPVGSGAPPVESATVDLEEEPLRYVDGLDAPAFFRLAAQALSVSPPHPTDFNVLARMAHVGLVPGRPFDETAADGATIAEGVADARARLAAAPAQLTRRANGWGLLLTDIGVYGNAYLSRAMVTQVGLGANPVEDAIYPLLLADADGRPLDGGTDYVLHFDAEGLPPVDGFWSVTMYDREGFQIPNELGRFALGDRDPLIYNPDGSLDLYLSRDRPDDARLPNWLPAGDGPLGVTLRLYAPRPEALDGRWAPPAVRREG
ncbi:DUF1254 domain-containing protein [Leifsonia sp. F6_8S_P_1B]|uniref:DUF1254 domain-containing protein n=1 Tax=Leifsonia williamsii TaxID=3035919 RepID=A0ABT8K8L8_9MICO|nr:DUF1254 domain-containing protein [Leifsonia williamsii]MDN4613811.1 DUF1254 domain-containing protein [Leifsonia williamsii]